MEYFKKKYLKSCKGITLIALVITIIVLLILAGISISMLSGNNSILQKSTTAKENTHINQIQERINISYHSALIEGQGKLIESLLENELKKEFNKTTLDEGWLDKTSMDGKWKITIDEVSLEIPTGNDEENILTDIFVAEYIDGTLVLSNNENDIDNEKISVSYGNIKDEVFYEWENLPSWSNDRINKVKIINKILPKNMDFWFYDLNNLTEIQNIENINTKNVTSMQGLFSCCFNISNIDLSHFDTSNVINMSYMFWRCEKLEILDLSNFNTSKVTSMERMFGVLDDDYGRLTRIIVGNGWDTTAVTNSDYMFDRQFRLKGKKDTAYSSSHNNVDYAHIDGGISNPGYFWGEESDQEISFYLCDYNSGRIYGPFYSIAGLTWREWINTYSPEGFGLSESFVEYWDIGVVYPKDTANTDTDDLRDVLIHDGATYFVVGN